MTTLSPLLVQWLTARVGKHGAGADWQTLVTQIPRKLDFLLDSPERVAKKEANQNRVVIDVDLSPNGLEMCWVAVDEGLQTTDGQALTKGDRWVLNRLVAHSPSGRHHSGQWRGALPFDLTWTQSYAEVHAQLGDNTTGPPTPQSPRVSFFLPNALVVELTYRVSSNALSIQQLLVTHMGVTTPF